MSKLTPKGKMMEYLMTLILLSGIILQSHVSGETIQEAKRLLDDKLLNYDKTFRPVVNQSVPVVIYMSLDLVSIQEFDEVQEKLTIAAVINLNWVDESMRWNPSDFGGTTKLVIESDKVWTPNLALLNNFNKLEKIGDSWQVIRFTADGVSYYFPGNIFSASCKVDVTYYPWDRHRCCFSFSVWAFNHNEIQFKSTQPKVLTTYFSENGAWSFVDSSVETYGDNAFINFYLHLERKPRFVFVNVILPIIFMAFLNTLIFVIPVESGERISFSLTVLLALAVFLTLVGDNMPKTSSPMSIFSYYLVTVLVISICITLATTLSVHLYFADETEEVKGILANFVRCMNCNCNANRYKKKRQCQETINRNGISIVSDKLHQNGMLKEGKGHKRPVYSVNNGPVIFDDNITFSL